MNDLNGDNDEDNLLNDLMNIVQNEDSQQSTSFAPKDINTNDEVLHE
jgi:hypothetical protein